ncbi:MAG TPA: hypothetical protein VL995_04080 [Cellvibrio sp.]|nr:hypothetical protein [Cellvibrio sp.]
MGTIKKKTSKLLSGYIKKTYSPAWARGARREIALLCQGEQPSLMDLAKAFPSGSDLEHNRREEPDYTTSKIQWSKLLSGKICVAENSLTFRVEKMFPELTDIRVNLLWAILGNPLATKKELKKIVLLLEPKLGDKMFYTSEEKPGFQYKKLFSSTAHYELVESVDAFTLKLVIYRLKKLEEIGDEWPCDIKDLTLHLFRLCAQTPYVCIASRLVCLFWIFVDCNRENAISESKIKQYVEETDVNQIYQQTAQLISLDSEIWANRYPTFNHYLRSSQLMIQNFWNICFPQWKDYPPDINFSLVAPYWADKYSSSWLSPHLLKEETFTDNTELLNECYHNTVRGRLKQIW